VRRIKTKVDTLSSLSFPTSTWSFILEIDALDDTRSRVLIEKVSTQERTCDYVSRVFKDTKFKYPSSDKEILVIKISIARFRLYLKTIHFIVKIDLKHNLDMLHHEKQ
jgi:hypothetical protein